MDDEETGPARLKVSEERKETLQDVQSKEGFILPWVKGKMG